MKTLILKKINIIQEFYRQKKVFCNLIGIYLTAIVAANYIVATYGPAWSIFNAFVFIGLNITTRDYLHDFWQGKQLKRNMFLLIAAGSILSMFFNARWIAVASFTAFMVSESVDALVYHHLGDYPRWLRINGSNIPSAAVDSLIFPILAFGFPVLWVIVVGQFLAKTLGGAVWSIVLTFVEVKRDTV